MRATALLVLAGCVTAEPVRLPQPCLEARPSTEVAAARDTLKRFIGAVEHRDFETALALLSPSVRRRYSAERLRTDFLAEPRGAALLGRAKVAADGPVLLDDDRARFEVANREFTVLHFESGRWHVVSLDADSEAK